MLLSDMERNGALKGEVNLVVASVVIVKAHQQSIEGTRVKNSHHEYTYFEFSNSGGSLLN